MYTIADVWTFVRGRIDWSQQHPAHARAGVARVRGEDEAVTILAILASIVRKYEGA